MGMFCYQCEQTAKGQACTVAGVCGKSPEVAALQDLLVREAKGIGALAHRVRKAGGKTPEADRFVVEALFYTVTNVNFDADRFVAVLKHAGELKTALRARLAEPGLLPFEATAPVPADKDGMVAAGVAAAIANRQTALGVDRAGLQELLTYGLKGMAAYADHARILGQEDDAVHAYFHEALDFLTQPDPAVDALVGQVLKCGEINLRVMELLDLGNTGAYGHPEPTQVRVTAVKGKCILVSGHDLKDLDDLLRQTEGKGVNIYTHGEMLPCHAYPGLKKYKHLVGNFGGAWQDQQKEFDAFPGAILFTTNCIQKPRDSYAARVFTTGLVGWPGVRHVANGDFSAVIACALAQPGFAADEPEKKITIGFARNTVMSVAGKVIDAVKAGQIKHFFLVGGCDGAKSGRNYYTDFAEQAPKDTVILTLACGKYRFNKLDLGDIGGIPRLLDVGQCNDAYSAIQIAVALANAFQTDVNSLPLKLVLSWYEQKAVCILLTLLHLGIRDIRLGPSLPAFVTPAVLQVLVDKFAIKPIAATAAEDLHAILGKDAVLAR